MSRKLGLILSYTGIGLVVCYFAYAAGLDGYSMEKFFSGYLASSQKYLFLMSIFITPILLCTSVEYFEPTIRIRLKDKLLHHVIQNGFRVSVLTSFGICGLFFVSALLWNLKFSFGMGYALYLIKMFLFVYSAYLVSNAFYFCSGKQVLSVFMMAVMNFLLLIIIYGIDFYAMDNMMSEGCVNIIYEIYIALSIAGSLGYLCMNTEKEVCLVKEK